MSLVQEMYTEQLARVYGCAVEKTVLAMDFVTRKPICQKPQLDHKQQPSTMFSNYVDTAFEAMKQYGSDRQDRFSKGYPLDFKELLLRLIGQVLQKIEQLGHMDNAKLQEAQNLAEALRRFIGAVNTHDQLFTEERNHEINIKHVLIGVKAQCNSIELMASNACSQCCAKDKLDAMEKAGNSVIMN